MATYVPAKRGVAYRTWIGLVSQASRPQFQGTATLAAGDVKVSKDGGALANLTTLPVVTPAASKLIQVDLSAAEMTADVVTIIFSDAAGAEWDDLILVVPTVARQIDDLAYPATSGRSMIVDAAGLVDANVVKVGPTGAGTAQTAGDIMADTNDIQARLPAALVGGRMDSSVGAMAAAVITAAAHAANALDANALAADAVTEIQAGLSTLTQANVRTAVGLAAANLDTQLSTIDDFLDTEVVAIKAKTDNLPASPAATGDQMALTAAAIDAILDDPVEGALTMRQLLRIVLAAAAGKGDGFPLGPVHYRDQADAKNRITATVDADGNRSAVTVDGS